MIPCSKCGLELPSSAFYKRKNRPRGFSSWCKSCHLKHHRIYYKKHKSERTKCIRAYDETHKQEKKQYNQTYFLSHKKEESERGRKYRKAHPEIIRAKSHRRRAKIFNVESEKFIDIEIFERDGWICGICGKHVDETLKYPHRRSASLDHIVPLSAGGSHAKKNTQLAHLMCNLAKSIKRNGQLRLIG